MHKHDNGTYAGGYRRRSCFFALRFFAFQGTEMKSWFIAMMAAVMAIAFMPTDADARRFGGGRSSGMQRTAPPPKPAAPAATPNNAGAGAAAAKPKSSWLGPVAGLAAGLGLAALFSHLGLGEELANFVMLALLAFVAVIVIRALMRRMGGGGNRMAQAGAAAGSGTAPGTMQRSSLDATPPRAPSATSGIRVGSALAPAAVAGLPADFDHAGFERIARMIFIRMQTANDNADLQDLRTFTTPELFAALRVDLQDRNDARQQTDVLRIDPQVVDFAEEGGSQIVSVRYQGEVREEPGAAPSAVDEVWHLVRPVGSDGGWRIAGVQQQA